MRSDSHPTEVVTPRGEVVSRRINAGESTKNLSVTYVANPKLVDRQRLVRQMNDKAFKDARDGRATALNVKIK